jgi:biopolymer transport protein ExbD
MKVFLEPDDLDVRIEIIPLIDVIFCILVFFILGAVNFTRLSGLNVDLPQAETAQTQFSDTLPVEIDALGQIKVDNTPLTEAQLSQLLGNYVRQKPQGVVVLQADKLVSYGQVSRLIDALQKVGGSRVALGAIKQPPGDQNGSSLNPLGGSVPDLPTQSQPNLAPTPEQSLTPTVPTLPNAPSSSVLPQQPGQGVPATNPDLSVPTIP